MLVQGLRLGNAAFLQDCRRRGGRGGVGQLDVGDAAGDVYDGLGIAIGDPDAHFGASRR